MLVQLCLTGNRFIQRFIMQKCSRKLWGEGESVFVFPRLIADIQKKREACLSQYPYWCFWGTKKLTGSSCLRKQCYEIFLYCQLCLFSSVASLYTTLTSSVSLFCKMIIGSGELPQICIAAFY